MKYYFVYWIIDENSLQLILQDCTQVPTDGKRHTSFNASYGLYDGNLDQLNPPITSEIKDGQWLGVEVQSQGEGGKVILSDEMKFDDFDTPKSANATSQDNFHVKIIFK